MIDLKLIEFAIGNPQFAISEKAPPFEPLQMGYKGCNPFLNCTLIIVNCQLIYQNASG